MAVPQEQIQVQKNVVGMKKIFSYLWPNTRRFSSEINGTLEVTYFNGKKLLDTEDANYSYGSLQKILEFGLTKVDLSAVHNALLLGMGGGSIIKSLRESFEYHDKIVAVEIDPAIIRLARDEFGISPSENLEIVAEDAWLFTQKAVSGPSAQRKKFQLIIIDLFLGLKVPAQFYESEFCQNISELTDSPGMVIFNAGVNLKKESEILQKINTHFGSDFNSSTFLKVNGTNALWIGAKRP